MDMSTQTHVEAIEAAVRSMTERLAGTFLLSDMARRAGMSEFHFCRTFHAVTGIPPKRFLAALRLSHATRLLLTSEASVLEICLSVGYSSLGTFVRRFTELAGVSPRAVRRLAPAAHRVFDAVSEAPALPSCGGAYPVEIESPETFSGMVIVGVFPDAIPQGSPHCWAMLPSRGRTSIHTLAPRCWIFAAGFPSGDDPVRCLLEGRWMRASAPATASSTRLSLRAARITDPPLVFMVPAVVVKLFGAASEPVRSAPAWAARGLPGPGRPSHRGSPVRSESRTPQRLHQPSSCPR